jgi:hypothetical protein
MRRAIQTSILMFPLKFKREKIKVVPGIQEVGFGPGNTFYGVKQNKEYLIKWCEDLRTGGGCSRISDLFKSKEQVEKCVLSLYSEIENSIWKSIRRRKDIEEKVFIGFLYKYLSEKKIKNVSIVSHSNYMKRRVLQEELVSNDEKKLLRKGGKLHNNQIMEKKYICDGKNMIPSGQKIHSYRCVHVKREVKCFD